MVKFTLQFVWLVIFLIFCSKETVKVPKVTDTGGGFLLEELSSDEEPTNFVHPKGSCEQLWCTSISIHLFVSRNLGLYKSNRCVGMFHSMMFNTVLNRCCAGGRCASVQ